MNQEARFSRMEPELRKANLIEATLTCLKRHGFQGASIRKISAEAGVSVGLISHHYSGKDELVAEAYMAITGRVMTLLRDAMEQAAPNARERLSAFFRGSFSAELLDPQLIDAWLAFWGAVKPPRRSIRPTSIPMVSIAASCARYWRSWRKKKTGKTSTPISRPSVSARCSMACGWSPDSTPAPLPRSKACRFAKPGSTVCRPVVASAFAYRRAAVDQLFSSGYSLALMHHPSNKKHAGHQQ
jgi:AcrR family transcriptional regulator